MMITWSSCIVSDLDASHVQPIEYSVDTIRIEQ
jgi:hypothetical protein